MIRWVVQPRTGGIDWSLPTDLVDWAQLLSAVLSLIALVAAFYSIQSAKRDLAKELHTSHELDVLRDMNDVLLRQTAETARELYGLLLLLPESDLPMVRAAVDAKPSDKARRDFAEKYPEAMELAAPITPDQTFWTRRYHRFKLLREDGTSRRELDEAIERRLHT